MKPEEVFVLFDSCWCKIISLYGFKDHADEALNKLKPSEAIWTKVMTLEKAITLIHKSAVAAAIESQPSIKLLTDGTKSSVNVKNYELEEYRFTTHD